MHAFHVLNTRPLIAAFSENRFGEIRTSKHRIFVSRFLQLEYFYVQKP